MAKVTESISNEAESRIITTLSDYRRYSDIVARYLNSVCQGNWKIEIINGDCLLCFNDEDHAYTKRICEKAMLADVDFPKLVIEAAKNIAKRHLPRVVMKNLMKL